MNNNEKEMEKLNMEYQRVCMPEKEVETMREKINQAKIENRRRQRKRLIVRFASAAAAVAVSFIILPNTSSKIAYAMSNIPIIGRLVDVVTFRNYEYGDENNEARVEVPEIVTGDLEGSDERLEKTAEEINAEIKRITDEILAEFKASLAGEPGHQAIYVSHEILSTSSRYFALKLIYCQSEGSSAEWDYFYTIDLQTGERVALKDLFDDGSDYITAISENIKKQMREQMESGERTYWLDDENMGGSNFTAIDDLTSFYINSDNKLVIAFNEGDVAPMYMGCVEFVIEDEALEAIRK